jgi:hypothetical protein
MRLRLYVLFLCILVAFSFISKHYSIDPMSNSEMGQYDYLEPITTPLDDNTIKKVGDRINLTLGKCRNEEQSKMYMFDISTYKTHFLWGNVINNITQKEAEYYIKNGTYPSNTYISDYLKSTPEFSSSICSFNLNNTTIFKLLSVRNIYRYWFENKDSKINPKPEAYEIFQGTKKPPESSKIYNLNFEELKTICEKY